MDGNNRWSKKNKTNNYNGYKKGANTIIKLSNYIFHNTDARYVSAFALSKNNLNRSTDKDNLYILGSNNIKQKIIGDQINSNDLRKKYIDKIDLRLLEINKNIFYKILDEINIEIGNTFAQLVFETLSTPADELYSDRSGNYDGGTGLRTHNSDPYANFHLSR